ncbi:acyl-CoA thioesterase [[Limnothrix rosea] IAM M-220]|uniref:acyl-CoA thioesterase n=1 Tax=[Limnothrix rosea] IAM M-220 TaxID=454133 RepID=UPI00095B782D|nr:thioesterase family protein [[Limnothrix rosea] IAM M-220]OKH18211.1 1,4-dihydroxy-2-naphthoyl-CoA hydrolase [[Limnothrix rosea] IAM M-220]
MGYSYHRTVHLADTDAAGVIYFASLLNLCHEAYEHCLSEVGLNWQHLLEAKEFALPIIHAEIDFLRPVHWDDRLIIELFPVSDAPSQFMVRYQILLAIADQSPSKPVAIAITKHVAISPQTRQRRPLPAILEKWLKNGPKYPEQKK